MNEITRTYFKKYITHGLGHTNISSETVSFYKKIIRPKVETIASQLPICLQTAERLDQLTTDLAEASVIIQGFGIRSFGVVPNEDLWAKETRHLKKDEPYSVGYSTPINDSITRFSAKLEQLTNDKSPSVIQIKVDGIELTVPTEIQSQLVRSLRTSLEDIKAKNKPSVSNRPGKELNIFFNLVGHKLARFIQLEYLQHPSYHGKMDRPELHIIAFTLMAAGFVSTPGEYELKKKVKDHRKVIDKNHLELTGMKRLIRKTRYYTHNEVLVMAAKGTMRPNGRFNARLLNWYWS